MNNLSIVSWSPSFPDGRSEGYGLFTQSALIARDGDTIGGATLGVPCAGAINDHATMAFLDSAGRLFTQSALIAYRGATISGKTLERPLKQIDEIKATAGFPT